MRTFTARRILGQAVTMLDRVRIERVDYRIYK